MEILKNFGLNPLLLAAQIINFLILVYLLKRFFFKKVLEFLKTREEKIKAGLEAAQKGEELLAKTRVSQREILNKARQEGKVMLQNFQKTGEEMAQKLRETGQKEADRIIEEAKSKAEEEGARIQQQLTKETLQVAISLLEKSLRGLLTSEVQKKIVNNMARSTKTSL